MNRSVLYTSNRDCNTQTALWNMQIIPIWADVCWQFFALLLVIRHDKIFYFSQNGIFGCHNIRKEFVEEKSKKKFTNHWCFSEKYDPMGRWCWMIVPQDMFGSNVIVAFCSVDILFWSVPLGAISTFWRKLYLTREININNVFSRESRKAFFFMEHISSYCELSWR